LNSISKEKLILLLGTAHTDPAYFAEEVLKDEQTGELIRLAPHHLEWFAHLDRCAAAGKFCGILAPPSSGKSQIFAVGYPLWRLGRDPALRVRALMSSGQEAKKRIRPAREYVEGDPDFRRVFPGCIPRRPDKWTDYEFNVARRRGIKDPSYAAAGIEHPPIGARIDLLICDDVVTYENVIAEPAMREKTIGLFYNGYDTRLSPDSFALYIGGVIHQRDLTSALMQDARFWFIKQSVSADFGELVQEDLSTGATKRLPLWDRAWNPDWLRKKHAANARAFERAYRHVGYSDEERTFAAKAVRESIQIGGAQAGPHAPRIMGVDLAGKSRAGNVIALVADARPRRIVEEIHAGAWSSDETARRIASLYERARPAAIVVENNAYQQALIDWMRVVCAQPLPIVPFTTGKQKADELLGLPGLAAEFANGMWSIPFDSGHVVGMGCPCGKCLLVRELEEHPFGSSDAVMSIWFARHGIISGLGSPTEMEFSEAPRIGRGRDMRRMGQSRLARLRNRDE
jgi:hypothetical protein